MHGYGCDAYFATCDQSRIQNELKQKGIEIVKKLSTTDYANNEFIFEIEFGIGQILFRH